MAKDYTKRTIEVDGWQVSDLPIKHSMEEYDEARKEVVEKVRNAPDLAALFEYGLIPVPGISDMDFWGVFPDDSETMHIPAKPDLPKKSAYLMRHLITVISEKHYKKMIYLDPWLIYAWPNGHNLLYQRGDIKKDMNFELINFSPEEQIVLSAIYSEELLGAVYAMIPAYVNKKIEARGLFESLKDCVYVILRLNDFVPHKIESTFPEDFRELRKNWFEIEEKEAIRRLVKVLRQGIFDGFKAAFALDEWLEKSKFVSMIQAGGLKKAGFLNGSCLDKANRNIYSIPFMRKRVFSDAVTTPEKAFELSVNSCQKIKVASKPVNFYLIFQPYFMASIFLAMAGQKGILSDKIRGDIFTNQKEVPVFKHKIFDARAKIINEITEVYNEKQRPDSYGKGFLFGNNRYGYMFKNQGLRNKILRFYLERKFWSKINQLFRD